MPDPSLPLSAQTMHRNLGPGGCVPWDDIAAWMRRVQIHVRALESAGNIEDVPAPALRPLWSVTATIQDELTAAFDYLGIEDA